MNTVFLTKGSIKWIKLKKLNVSPKVSHPKTKIVITHHTQ